MRFYLPDSSIEAIQYKEYQVKIFPTDLWNQYIDYPLDSLMHDVVKDGANKERGSMVYFVNPAFGRGPYSVEDEGIDY